MDMRLTPLAGTAGFISHCIATSTRPQFSSFARRSWTSAAMPYNEQATASAVSGDHFTIGLDPFCFRQFDDPRYAGTRIPMDKEYFMEQLHERLRRDRPPLAAGYAPFCKHIFVENFTDAKVSVLPITEDNKHLIRTGYLARRPEELAVLSRWLPAALVQDQLGRAKYLDLILYSKEQIAKESAAMNKTDKVVMDPEAPEWSLISIKAQNEPFELPMNPITIMRNALIEEGGSGVGIDRAAYARSVDYWSKHIIVQEDDA